MNSNQGYYHSNQFPTILGKTRKQEKNIHKKVNICSTKMFSDAEGAVLLKMSFVVIKFHKICATNI